MLGIKGRVINYSLGRVGKLEGKLALSQSWALSYHYLTKAFAQDKLLDSLDIVRKLQLIHSNRINHKLNSELSFPTPTLYLLRHTLSQMTK